MAKQGMPLGQEAAAGGKGAGMLAAALALLLCLGLVACSPSQPSEPQSEETAAEAVDEGEPVVSQAFPQDAWVSAADLKAMLDAGDALKVLDVRSKALYTRGCIEGSLNVPAGAQLELRLREVPHDTTLVIVGADSTDYDEVYQVLLDNDYEAADIKALEGGFNAWAKAGYPVVANDEYAC